MVILLCTVGACGAPLRRDGGSFACPAGHRFDLARAGYLNLLPPQGRRSRRPGDAREAVAARRRLAEGGLFEPLHRAVLRVLGEALASGPAGGRERPALLDVGSGEGAFLRAAAGACGDRVELHGMDLSKAAAALAARAVPGATIVVGNADRGLPYARRSFDAVTSLVARLNPGEMGRVLAPSGLLVVAVPGPEDLVELRERVQGRGCRRDRDQRLEAELGGGFELLGGEDVKVRRRLAGPALEDLLRSTYRGLRRSQQERREGLDSLELTLHWLVRWLRPGHRRGRRDPWTAGSRGSASW